MKIIPLTNGKVAKVNNADYAELSRNKWHAIQPAGKQWYAVCHRRKEKPSQVYMHRLLMGHPEGLVDHRNGDSLDNRRRNLRRATSAQNNANSKTPRDNTSGIKGVTFDRSRNKWLVRVGRDGFVGRFSSLSAAADAYKAAAKLKYGAFANPG